MSREAPPDPLDARLAAYARRFGQVEAAMHRLTWTVSLWGGVITILLGLFLTLGKR
jgi:hypothetical protein